MQSLPTDAGAATTQPASALDPVTGEIVELSAAEDRDLALLLEDIREVEQRLRDTKRAATDELLKRMDFTGSWTLRAGPYKLTAPSPQPVDEYDELALRSELLELVDRGEISITAVDNAIQPVVTYKARKSGIAALRKLGGKVAEIVERHTRQSDRRRYVSIEKTLATPPEIGPGT